MTREKKLLLIFLFNSSLMLLEFGGGIYSRSLALLSDAGHMLTDSFAVFLSYIAVQWSARPATAKKTFGYHRIEILVALINGLALLAISGYIFYEAANRFFHPEPIKTGVLLVIATIGLIGNIAGAVLIKHEGEHSLNIRSTFLHLVSDALSSVGVIIGGVIIVFTGWTVVDSLIGILIGGIVLRGAVSLVLESSEVLLESTPSDIDMELVKQEIEAIEGVHEVHDVHIWTITSGRRALSGHVLIGNITTREGQAILCQIRTLLAEKFHITHTTLETECDVCDKNVCEFVHNKPIENKKHGGHHHDH